MKKQTAIFISIINSLAAVYAQGEIDVQPTVFFRNEWTVALMLNSNGFGGNYRYGKRIDAANKRLFEIDFAYIKDPKEKKSYSMFTMAPARYVEGKANHAFDFRLGYGKQHEKFRKHDAGGVAIRWFYNVGPSAVFLKPIYYKIARVDMQAEIEELPPAKYDTQWMGNNIYIYGREPFTKGFSEIKAIPGAFAKFGFNFEFGKDDRVIHALEAGVTGEAFLKKVQIMDFSNPDITQTKTAQNRQFFLSLFVSYRFGRIVDPYEIRKKREKTREISY